MGIFNAYLGLWFAVALVLIVPYLIKHYRVEWMTVVCLAITGLAEILAAALTKEWLLWLVAVPLAMAVQTGFTSMLTSFSNAVDSNSQGWAMGITGSVIAISFALTGFSPNLVPLVGTKELILIGGILMIAAFFVMLFYCKRILPRLKGVL